MILVTGVLVEASSGKAARSYAKGVTDLAAHSILTEYQRTLKNEYGLFAFYGDKALLENKMKWYINASADKSEDHKSMDVLRLKSQSIQVDPSGYSLTDMNVLEDEINQYMKYHLTEKVLQEIANNNESDNATYDLSKSLLENKKKSIESLEKDLQEEERQNSEEDTDSEEKKRLKEGRKKLKKIKSFGESELKKSEEDHKKSNIVLRNKAVLNTLPSVIMEEQRSFLPGGLKTIAVNEYILDTFQNHLHHSEERNRFFQNEVEYILGGEASDEKNYRKVKKELLAMRTALNIAYLYSDMIKREEALTLATSLTPGPWVPITQFIIITAWGSAEAAHDLKLLEEGNKVPLMKDDGSFALSLEGLLEEKSEVVTQAGNKGLDYEGYLRLLLVLKNREEKLLRIMDLIQINLKGECDGGFLLQDYCVGFSYQMQMEKQSGFFQIMGTGKRAAQWTGSCSYR